MREEQTLKRSSLRLSGNSWKERAKNPAITFVCTAALFVIMLLIAQKYPVGDYTVLVSDLEAQYAPYLFLLKSKLLNLNFSRFFTDFGYSFLLGAGKGMAGTFGYYLASPFNLLVVFFKAHQVNEFVMLLMGLKVSLAAAFTCAFIEERAEVKGTRWPILWGIMYAYSSYTMLFLFHIMWLDGYMLLPLLLLLIERYVKAGRKGSLTGITVVLFFLFLANYYIAYMAGIYSFLYLLARMYLLEKFGKEHAPLKMIGRFVLRAVLTGLTLCIILLPVGLDTIRNGDPTHSASDTSYVGFTFTSFLDRIFMGYPGDFSDILICNMPLIFVSLLVTILCTVYFVSKAFSGKAKRFYAVCFILIYATLCIDFLDVAWQVFDSPNWFWHREAFCFIPLFLTVSYTVFENLKKVTNAEILKAAGIIAILLLMAQSFGDMKTESKVFLFNVFTIAAIFLMLLGLKKEDWKGQLKNMGKILPVMLVLITVYEVTFLSPMLSSGTATLSVFTSRGDDYVSAVLSLEDCVISSDYLQHGFRSEYDNIRAMDDIGVGGSEQLVGYRGISLFNSNSNKAFGRFLKQLGCNVNYNYFAAGHGYSAPSIDTFFSIGTLYSTDETYRGMNFITSDDNLSFYTARTVLNPVFTVPASARDFNFYSLETATEDKNYFDFQNDWYRSLFPSFTEDFFIAVDDGDIEFEMLNGEAINIGDYQSDNTDPEESISSEEESSSAAFDPDDLGEEVAADYYDNQIDVYRYNKKLPIILDYQITVNSEDELYANISVPRTNGGCEVYLDGDLIGYYSPGTNYSTILRLGSYEVGDNVQFTLMADHDTFTYMQINFAYFDTDIFESQLAGVDAESTTITEADDGYVLFEADVDAGDMILTSIPYEEGWTAYVDGVETEIIPYQDALISLDAAPGHHDVRLQYYTPGVKAGAILSIVGIIGLIGVSIVDNKNKR